VTERYFLVDAYRTANSATVLASTPEGIILDGTVFYARSGGQPGDRGVLRWEGGETPIADTSKGEGEAILHIPPKDAALPPEGTAVTARLEWPLRLKHMRMHTALHLLCSLLPGAAVTGGQIGAERSRLDFDLATPPPRDLLEEQLAALITADHPISTQWVDESVLDAQPELVRTLSVKPPRGAGRIRLVRIGLDDPPVDLQPCGGTHVARTGEIGAIRIVKIENKGRQNRRISLAWPEV